MSRVYSSRKQISEINVVPYIDVMLVLLVIFMVTAPLLTQGVNVELPKANTKIIAASTQQPLIVSIDSSGYFYLNIARFPKRRISLADLQLRVAAELHRNSKRKIFVRGDKKVNYGQVIKLMANLQQVGAKKIGMITLGIPMKKVGAY